MQGHPAPTISSGQPEDMVVVEHGRKLHVFKVTEAEIDELASAPDSICFGLCTLCIGTFASFLISLITVQLSDRLHATFLGVVIATGGLTLLFGWQTIRERRQSKKLVKRLKNEILS
jgi:hypothetical protein